MLGDNTVGWTAATYFANFIAYLVVSVPELVLWVFYLFGNNVWFSWWVNGIGWWFSVVGMGLPVIFASLQLGLPYGSGGLSGDATVEFGANIIFLMSMGWPMWIQSASMHLLYAERLACHTEANPPVRSVDDMLAACDLERKDFETSN